MNSVSLTTSDSTNQTLTQETPTDSPLNCAPKAWGRREVVGFALAAGGAAVAVYRNHGAQCSIPRSILSYAAWQLPALIYCLVTEPMNLAEPAFELGLKLRRGVQKEMGIPLSQGICGSTSAIWLAAPDSFKESPKVHHVADIFESNKLKEATRLIYPEYQKGNFAMSWEYFNKYLLKHNIKHSDQFFIPKILCQQFVDCDNPAKVEEEARRATENLQKQMTTLNIKAVDSFPLEQLEVAESFVCIMAGNAQKGETSHMFTLTRIANRFVIFDPTAGFATTMKGLDECKSKLEQLESTYNKKLYHFTRYSNVIPEDRAV